MKPKIDNPEICFRKAMRENGDRLRDIVCSEGCSGFDRDCKSYKSLISVWRNEYNEPERVRR